MRKLLTVVMDLLFPPSNNQLIIRRNNFNRKSLYFPRQYRGIYYLCDYIKPEIKATINENKFNNNSQATKLLASILEIWAINQTENFIFIPIPLGPKRKRERGYNQVENILQAIKVPIQTRTDIIARPTDTLPQSKLHKKQRKDNIKNAFVCDAKKVSELVGVNIVLVDDVVTTGSTMGAARAELEPHLHPTSTLTCLAIAH